ncbi:hypothetical protein TNCV_4908441 [Trichonephila clavipes]|uniref:Uncharacterized protein n=1 Tax=Trichonephila clavipes TaxID=2585209 RepID=A0A8X6RMI9_TRICX|nr:hypothetical protein TNCV_4908441 [Trichonephila clavipes]
MKLKIQPTQVERSFENGGASPPRTALFTFQTLIKIEIFFQSRPLHRRSIHAEFKPLHRLNIYAEFKPLHRLNEVFENGGASPHGRFCSLSRLWFKIEILSIAAEPP